MRYSNVLPLSLLLCMRMAIKALAIDTDSASASASIDAPAYFDDAEVDYYAYGLENETETTEIENEISVPQSQSQPSMRGSISSSSSDSEESTEASTPVTEKKARKHQLVRRGRADTQRQAQQCSFQCFSNSDCESWAFSSWNASCRAYSTCINGACRIKSQPQCGNFCQNNNGCTGANDGCSQCINQTCTGSNNVSKCGWNCSNNFNICSGSTNGCTTCNGSTCQTGDRSGGFGNNSKCGQFCRNNPNICLGASDGCTFCNGSSGTCFSGGAKTCSSFCSFNSDCASALNGCTTCIGGTCQGNRSGVPGGGACVNDALTLQSRLSSGGNIQLCANSNIQISSEIVVTNNYITLGCFGNANNCVLRGGGSNRLLHFTGSNITLQGISFQGGVTTGAGGAIVIDGNSNFITNCKFYSNRASQQGGAGSVGTTTFFGNAFGSNVAGLCSNFYQKTTGSCFG